MMKKGLLISSLLIFLTACSANSSPAPQPTAISTNQPATTSPTDNRETSPNVFERRSPSTLPSSQALVFTSVRSDKCNLSVKIAKGWSYQDKEFARFAIPGYTTGCLIIRSPDFKSNYEGYSGLLIDIDRIKSGADYRIKSGNDYQDFVINTIDDFVTATEGIQEPKVPIQNVQVKSYGDFKGKYFEYSAYDTNSTFIFERTGYLYSVQWKTSYTGKYKSDIDTIIASISMGTK